MQKSKIVFLLEMSNNRGGMVQSVVSLIEGLSKYDEFDIITVSPRDSELSNINFSKNVKHITTSKREWTCSKSNLIGFISTCRDVRRIIKKLGRDCLYVTNNYGSSIVLSGCMLPWIREIFVCRGGNFRGSGLGGWFMRHKIRLHRFYHIISTSRRQNGLVMSHGQPKSKTSIIYNGLSIPTCEYSPAVFNRNNLRIATLGYISQGKNQEVGILLTKYLLEHGINASFYIYGKADCESDRQYKIHIDKIIADNNLTHHVHYMGFVTGEAPFINSDIILSSSLSEGFGRTIVEGMLRKRCVMSWRGAGGPVDITDNGRFTFLVDNNTPETYGNIILQLIDNPEMLSRNIDAAYKHALSMFTTESMIKNYRSFFNSIFRNINTNGK